MALSDATKQDVIQQLTETWKAAQKQLAELRAAVERAGQMAQLKLQSELAGRELDLAYRDLGEAVWSQVKKGRLELPDAIAAAAKAVEEIEKKKAAQAASINEILSEGLEVARRSGAKTVASRGKKR